MAIIKYVQSQYEAKIAELEQYYILLQQHLNKMENLKENMFQSLKRSEDLKRFWKASMMMYLKDISLMSEALMKFVRKCSKM